MFYWFTYGYIFSFMFRWTDRTARTAFQSFIVLRNAILKLEEITNLIAYISFLSKPIIGPEKVYKIIKFIKTLYATLLSLSYFFLIIWKSLNSWGVENYYKELESGNFIERWPCEHWSESCIFEDLHKELDNQRIKEVISIPKSF
jgi:hypothetical protein